MQGRKISPKHFTIWGPPEDREGGTRLYQVNCARVHLQGVPIHEGMTVPWYKPWAQTSFIALGWEGTDISQTHPSVDPLDCTPDPSYVPELLVWISTAAVYTLPWPPPSQAPQLLQGWLAESATGPPAIFQSNNPHKM